MQNELIASPDSEQSKDIVYFVTQGKVSEKVDAIKNE